MYGGDAQVGNSTSKEYQPILSPLVTESFSRRLLTTCDISRTAFPN